MANTNSGGDFPAPIIDAVKASVDKTYSALCGETPVLATEDAADYSGPRIAGIISFVGDVPWSFSWILTQESAPALAMKFTGMEIPFDSSDMGDMAGELVNVIAGEIISQLEQRRIKSQMSLPTVLRGESLEMMPESGRCVKRLDYTSNQGGFSLRLSTAIAGQLIGRMPGKNSGAAV